MGSGLVIVMLFGLKFWFCVLLLVWWGGVCVNWSVVLRFGLVSCCVSCVLCCGLRVFFMLWLLLIMVLVLIGWLLLLRLIMLIRVIFVVRCVG